MSGDVMSVDELSPRTSVEDLRVELSPTVPTRRITLGRLRGAVTWWCIAAAAVAAVGYAVGTVIAGRLAVHPTGALVALLALMVIGGAILDTAGRAGWAGVCDRAEGRLRGDLLSAALNQPLSALSETAVGEILDRVDDDTHELGMLLRRMAWDLVRTGLRMLPMWVVAGLTWSPAWILFPVTAALTAAAIRGPAAEVSRLKVEEEVAWTDHAAVMEEGVAARDDLRSSLGQAYLIRRCAELSAAVHRRVNAALPVHRRGSAGAPVCCCTPCSQRLPPSAWRSPRCHHHLTTAALITLFLVTMEFVGQMTRSPGISPTCNSRVSARCSGCVR